jgi:hypothetical protein
VTGGAGDTYTLQSAIETPPSPAVVNPTGHPAHGSAPEEFLNKPLTQGEQRNVEKENDWPAAQDMFPVKNASTRCTSESESFTLYTRMD